MLVRRLGLFFFAALIGVFGVGMANVAGYNALQRGTGNSELILDRKVSDKRTFPAIDISRSAGTQAEAADCEGET